MDNCKNNNEDVHSTTAPIENLSRITFEYTFPTCDEAIDDETSSNKSTPYYTPLEFFQNSFEFPSPMLDKTTLSPKNKEETSSSVPEIATPIETETTKRTQLPKSCSPVGFKQQLQAQSPALNRKLRRFSLYERRSCSPQHILTKNVSVDAVASEESHIDDKENTKPKHCDKVEDVNYLLSSSDNNSPKALIEESSSPKILTVANESGVPANTNNRLLYSPKLLASINNLNLSGSPLGVINSASYKNGNYFKFPEIDQIVQNETAAEVSLEDFSAAAPDNQKRVKSQNSYLKNENQSTVPANETFKMRVEHDTKFDLKRNRKNKNNLTIKITEVTCTQSNEGTPSPKLKTPTIKNTKEKALSLDSAAVDVEPKKVTFGTSCDEIDSNAQNVVINQLQQRRAMASEKFKNTEHTKQNLTSTTNRSNSLSHLTTLTDFHTLSVHVNKPGSNIIRTPRRRVMGASSSNDWLQYHRKQNPYNISIEAAKRSVSDTDTSEKSFFDGDVVILHEDDEVQGEESELQDISILSATTTAASAQHTSNGSRNAFKHNPLLHSSNANLKTLPEFLTLVEFNAGNTEHRSPYKQKSMELPITAQQPCVNTPTILHSSHVNTSNSSTNLLQRRGSNHSLTLNLHGSCSNLLGSCRSGLSVSNYSLCSMGNSTSNLNVTQSTNVPKATTSTAITTQNAKQSLFRRRGSNHSLTLTNLSATSCGNLNSFASQSSLNVEKTAVTRTTSFVTPTNNTTSCSITPKKGLLERRGSNQSLTLNMSSSLAISNTNLKDTLYDVNAVCPQKLIDPNCCAQTHQRKFFSSENLNKTNAPFGDLNQTHKRNANQVCFGSVSDLKPRDGNVLIGPVPAGKRDISDFPESSVCTCTGVRNIMTRPLSPQATSEEFKIYLAGIQMLQNASNPLNQEELIKLNFIFDNSYATNKNIIEQPLPGVLNIYSSKDVETPPGLTYTSEDFEVVTKYEDTVQDILREIEPSEEEQKRMFRDLHKEFWDLPLNHQEKPMVFGSQTKNRYKSILPNENSRVILTKEEKCYEEAILEDNNIIVTFDKQNGSIVDEQPYINANYIKGPDYTSKCYVATQGPLPNTIFEFWLMIFQNTKRFLNESNDMHSTHNSCQGNLRQYYQKIVMLTNFLENNRQKCSIYFPVELNEIFATVKHQEIWQLSNAVKEYFNDYLVATDEAEKIKIECLTTTPSKDLANELPAKGSFFVIKNIGIVRKNGFSVRKFVILYCMQFIESSTTRYSTRQRNKLCINRLICYHYWYPDWPDHRSPRDINALLDICLHILNLGKCEFEFENFNNDNSLKLHLVAQNMDMYQQDIFNAVQPLPVIHCSAGIGRTGCLTAILNAIRQLRQSLSYSLSTMAHELGLTLLEASCNIDVECDSDYHTDTECHHLIKLSNDTDSSFTRNTLLYIHHIAKAHQEKGLLMNDVKNQEEEEERKVVNTISLKQLPKLPNIFVDCLGIVCNLRLQRGGMVQNSEQYELIHRAICLYMKRTFALKRF